MGVHRRGDSWKAQISADGRTRYGPPRPYTPEGRELAQQDEAALIEEYRTKPQREREARELLGIKEPDREKPGDGITVAEFRDTWRELYPLGQASKPRQASTWVIYMERTKAYAAEHGTKPMRDGLSQREAREWCVAHPGSFGPLRTMYSDAARDRLLGPEYGNPFLGLRLGRSEGRRNIKPLGYDDMLDLLDKADAIAGPAFRALCALAAVVAMREAETFALSPWDVDMAAREIDVGWQFRSKVPAPWKGQPDERWARPKNREARRVALAPLALEALQAVPIPVDGPKRPDGAPIWLLTPEKHAHYTSRSHHYYWRQVRAAIGRPKMEFHELKHFAGWYMLNVLKIRPDYIAHQLAHKDTDLLFELYGHPEEQVAIDAVKEAFRRASGDNVRHLRPADEDGRQAA